MTKNVWICVINTIKVYRIKKNGKKASQYEKYITINDIKIMCLYVKNDINKIKIQSYLKNICNKYDKM